MGNRVLAIVGSYRKGGTVDSAVDAILDGARAKGAETRKIYLLDKHIEFCTNCRSCMQTPGTTRGRCVQQDDMEEILTDIDAADAVVLGAPVNMGNTTAIFRRFLERLGVLAYWPGGKLSPSLRITLRTRKAALVTSSAMPGFFIPIATGSLAALKMAAKFLGARNVGSLCIGLSGPHRTPQLSQRTLENARRLGAKLA